MKPEHDPWFYAGDSKLHGYITPENIQAAIDAGAAQLELWKVVLEALSLNQCEDRSLCAFIALNGYKQ